MKGTQLIKKLCLCLFAWLLAVQVYSQERIITGKIIDFSTKDPLPGSSVVVKGTTRGITTDINGEYQIKAKDGDILVFSFIGYKSQEIIVSGQQNISLELEAETIDVGELIVIGYGTVKKSDATGAVSVVGSDDFNKGTITTADQLLTGKAAGVQVTSGGGQPGSSTTIRIRGGSSLSSTNDPLIVIDGVPIETTGIDGMSNPLSTIHPEDIESFSVLKDASATAIYGSRASNGVIIITTKTGSKGGLKVNYSGLVSIATPSGRIDNLNADEFRALVNKKYPKETDKAPGLLGDSTTNTDWQKEIMQNALATDHNLSISGSVKEIMPYRASLGFTNQDGILKTSNLERFTGSINISPSFLNEHLTVGINVKGMQIKNQFAETGAVNNAVGFDPTQPVYSGDTANGGFFTWLDSDGDPIAIAPRNPVAQLVLRDNQSTVNRVIAGAKVDYRLHFLPEFIATVNLGTDRSESDGVDLTPKNAPWENQTDKEGRITNYTQNKKNNLLDIYFNYEKEITAINSKISATAGYSYQYFYNNKFSETTDWATDDTVTKGIPRPTDYVIMSYFGRLNYVLAKKYVLTLTLRQDMTSRFSEENRAGIFPAAAFAWNIKDENFMYNVESLSDLKLRLGYGITGQQYVTDDDYPYFGTYTSSTSTAQYQFGSQFYTTQRPEGYNPNLKWEETTTYNIGLDYGIMNNRFFGSVELYKRITNDLINKVPFPAGSNFINEFVQNIGSLENKGVEFIINAKAVSKSDLVWEIGFNASYNENKITKLTLAQDSTYLGSPYGDIGGAVGNKIQMNTVDYPAFSFFVFEQVYDENGHPIEGIYIDRNGDGESTEADKYHYKKPAPDIFMGINSTFTYKDISLSFAGRINLGNYVYNNIESQYADYSGMYNSVGYLGNRYRTIYDTEFEGPQYWSDYFVQNASFFRMDHITLNYTLNNVINDKSDVKIYGSVQNAFVITKYRGLDPERDNGIDNSVYPRPRTFTIGAKVDF